MNNEAKEEDSANEINNEINQIKIILICLIELFDFFWRMGGPAHKEMKSTNKK